MSTMIPWIRDNKAYMRREYYMDGKLDQWITAELISQCKKLPPFGCYPDEPAPEDWPTDSAQHAPSKEAGEIARAVADRWIKRCGIAFNRSEIIVMCCKVATELNKEREAERVKYEAQLKAIKEDRDAILDDRDGIAAKLLATQQVCERYREALIPFSLGITSEPEGYRLFHDLDDDVIIYSNYGRHLTAGDFRRVADALGIKTATGLYGKCIEGIKRARDTFIKYADMHLAKGNQEKADRNDQEAEHLTQLLADLGQRKP